jgi:hypothetical protein
MPRRLLFALLIFLCWGRNSLVAEDFRIESTPPGASVEIEGKVVGATPYIWAKLPGGYFHKTRSVFGARLERPLHARLILSGYVTQDIELTIGPMKWIALNGTYHGDYYLLKGTGDRRDVHQFFFRLSGVKKGVRPVCPHICRPHICPHICPHIFPHICPSPTFVRPHICPHILSHIFVPTFSPHIFQGGGLTSFIPT